MNLPGLKTQIVFCIATLLLGAAAPTLAQTVPTDAAGGCPIPAATVAGFFESGHPSLNGVVKPADSTQVLVPNCGFFQWTEQMFLWLTSPAPSRYGGGSRIMFSPSFYTVSPEDGSNPPRRTFLANTPGRPLIMNLRATELGPHGLPALLSRSGHVIEVERQPAPRPVIRLQNGTTVPLAKVERAPGGELRFLDAKGKVLEPAKLLLPKIERPIVMLSPEHPAPVVEAKEFQQAIRARKLTIDHIPIFFDLAGNVIDVEPGQADGGVLISQNGSLIYYITLVNDLYAYHRTMQGPAVIPPSTNLTFPMTMADANAVKTFAASKGHTITDPQALAIESKSSWVEASAVANANDYITVDATIPTYNKSNPNSWVPNGQKTVKLVMVGLHVVGSTNGHGEMVWGSFEHLGNAPDETYAYNSTSGQKTVARNTNGSWLFTPSGSSGPFNLMNASASGNTITGSPIGATAVIRAKPWGSNDGGNPANAAALNTQVISANASVLSQLDPADVRAKYFQLGTTWTIGGAPPSPSNQVGTNHLANATIETFMQGQTTSDAGSNCFSCHGTNKVVVSHVYSALKPLP